MDKIKDLELLKSSEVANYFNSSIWYVNNNAKQEKLVSVNIDNIRRFCKVDIYEEEGNTEKEVLNKQEVMSLLKISASTMQRKREFFNQFLVNKKIKHKYSKKKLLAYLNKERSNKLKVVAKEEKKELKDIQFELKAKAFQKEMEDFLNGIG